MARDSLPGWRAMCRAITCTALAGPIEVGERQGLGGYLRVMPAGLGRAHQGTGNVRDPRLGVAVHGSRSSSPKSSIGGPVTALRPPPAASLARRVQNSLGFDVGKAAIGIGAGAYNEVQRALDGCFVVGDAAITGLALRATFLSW